MKQSKIYISEKSYNSYNRKLKFICVLAMKLVTYVSKQVCKKQTSIELSALTVMRQQCRGSSNRKQLRLFDVRLLALIVKPISRYIMALSLLFVQSVEK